MCWNKLTYRLKFNRSRRYQVSYSVVISESIKADEVIVLPYPQTTDYQTVSNFEYASSGEVEIHDQFIVCRDAGEAEISCSIDVKPRTVILPDSISQADYAARFDAETYCLPDKFIQPELPAIQAVAERYQTNKLSIVKLTKQLYDHTISTLHYGDPIPGLYSTNDALTREQVDCGGFATYLAALMRACQIPCRIISGFWAGQKHNQMHAWLEYMLPNGQWVALDPSTDYLLRQRRTRKVAGYNWVGSDRIVIAVGSDHHLNISGREYQIGFLQTPLLLRNNGQIDYLSNYQLVTK